MQITQQPAVGRHEEIVNDAPRSFSDAEFPIGTVAHQGDLILVRIAELPGSAVIRKDRQLAIGSTQGSRHVLETGIPYDCNALDVQAAITDACKRTAPEQKYIGPVFQTKDGVAELTHPEHGDHKYVGDMTIAVVYQRNLDSEERERITID